VASPAAPESLVVLPPAGLLEQVVATRLRERDAAKSRASSAGKVDASVYLGRLAAGGGRGDGGGGGGKGGGSPLARSSVTNPWAAKAKSKVRVVPEPPEPAYCAPGGWMAAYRGMLRDRRQYTQSLDQVEDSYRHEYFPKEEGLPAPARLDRPLLPLLPEVDPDLVGDKGRAGQVRKPTQNHIIHIPTCPLVHLSSPEATYFFPCDATLHSTLSTYL
jgi:hypothetical protein